MQRFKNVLFFVTGNKNEHAALLHLAEDVKAAAGKLTLMDVVADVLPSAGGPETNVALVDMQKQLVKNQQQALKATATKLRKALPGLKVSTLVREGTDYIEIIRQVQQAGHDLLAKVADNSGPVTSLLFGALDMNLLRKCPVPVLILKGRRKIKTKRVLAAVDLVRHEKSRENLDRLIVDLATSIAGEASGRVDILHAWHLPYEKKLRNEERIRSYQTVETMLRELRKTEKTNLELLAADYGDGEVSCHLIKGKPQEVIPRFAKAHRSHLVVMGTVGRTGIAGFFIGNTAEKILQNLECSVLALKPEGFKSPVA